MTTPHPLTARTTTPTKPKPPCAASPDDWDLDIGTPDIWHQAVRICHDCPMLAQCRERAAALTARGMPPRSMIWAAVGYDASGNPIDNLDDHRTRRTERKQPLHIVHAGPTYSRPTTSHQPDTTPTNPQRTIVLRRRPLSPTGTTSR